MQTLILLCCSCDCSLYGHINHPGSLGSNVACMQKKCTWMVTFIQFFQILGVNMDDDIAML